jgi:hypothetical protein
VRGAAARHHAARGAHAVEQLEAESTLRIVREIEIESQKLADVGVAVIVFAATAPSLLREHLGGRAARYSACAAS